jgi:hypothetical protein
LWDYGSTYSVFRQIKLSSLSRNRKATRYAKWPKDLDLPLTYICAKRSLN